MSNSNSARRRVVEFLYFFIFINVSSREKINFDRLDIPGPKTESTADFDKRNTAAIKSGDLLGVSNSNLCKGAACCADNQEFKDNKCATP